MEDLKRRLDNEAFEKLKAIIKQNTNINNLTKDNIEVVKKAVDMFRSWVMEVYSIDRAEIVNDEIDIEQLFKTKNQ